MAPVRVSTRTMPEHICLSNMLNPGKVGSSSSADPDHLIGLVVLTILKSIAQYCTPLYGVLRTNTEVNIHDRHIPVERGTVS